MERLTWIKGIFSVLLFIFSAAVLQSHTTSRLYPSAHVSLFLSITLLATIYLQWRSGGIFKVTLLGVLFVSIGYRLLIFSHPPTFYSIDVDWLVLQAYNVLETGTIEKIPAGFYQEAPSHIVHIATVAAVTGMDVTAAQAATPLVLGIVIPLFGWIFAARLGAPIRACYLAAVISAVTTVGHFHSWLPIAQSTTVSVFFIGLLALISLRDRSQWQWLMLLVISVLSLVYMHKIPLVLFTVIVVVVAIVMWAQQRPDTAVFYQVIPLLVGVLLMIQLVFLTNFVTGVVGRFAGLFTIEVTSQVDPQAAVPTTTGTVWAAANSANVLGILTAGGIAWLYGVGRWWNTRSTTMIVLLVVSAIGVVFTVALIPYAIPTRALLMIEPILAALIATLAIALVRTQPAKYLIAIGLITLIATQSFALIAMPDNPQQPIRYADSDELEAKAFTHEYAPEQPYMDSRYAQFMLSPKQPETRSNENWLDGPLLNAAISPDEHPTILYRDRTTYDMRQGWYQLTWNPIPYLDHEYNRVYDNGNANYYHH